MILRAVHDSTSNHTPYHALRIVRHCNIANASGSEAGHMYVAYEQSMCTPGAPCPVLSCLNAAVVAPAISPAAQSATNAVLLVPREGVGEPIWSDLENVVLLIGLESWESSFGREDHGFFPINM